MPAKLDSKKHWYNPKLQGADSEDDTIIANKDLEERLKHPVSE